MTARPASDRVRIRREPARGRYAASDVEAVLDAGLIAHVAFVDDGQPYCIPTLCARIGVAVYIHGSRASRALKMLGGGVPACLTVTLLDGLVLARSVFEHSANYRSAVVLGRFTRVEDDDARLAAYEAFTEKILLGRWAEARRPTARELRATDILSMPIDEASAKVRTGPPTDDDSEDSLLDVWAGVVPITPGYGAPEASPGLRPGISLPPSVERLLAPLDRRGESA